MALPFADLKLFSHLSQGNGDGSVMLRGTSGAEVLAVVGTLAETDSFLEPFFLWELMCPFRF